MAVPGLKRVEAGPFRVRLSVDASSFEEIARIEIRRNLELKFIGGKCIDTVGNRVLHNQWLHLAELRSKGLQKELLDDYRRVNGNPEILVTNLPNLGVYEEEFEQYRHYGRGVDPRLMRIIQTASTAIYALKHLKQDNHNEDIVSPDSVFMYTLAMTSEYFDVKDLGGPAYLETVQPTPELRTTTVRAIGAR